MVAPERVERSNSGFKGHLLYQFAYSALVRPFTDMPRSVVSQAGIEPTNGWFTATGTAIVHLTLGGKYRIRTDIHDLARIGGFRYTQLPIGGWRDTTRCSPLFRGRPMRRQMKPSHALAIRERITPSRCLPVQAYQLQTRTFCSLVETARFELATTRFQTAYANLTAPSLVGCGYQIRTGELLLMRQSG